MKKLLKKLSVMRLEERVLFDAAAAAAAAEAENQALQNEELQQQQQQLQEQLAAEAARQQAAQAEAEAEEAAAESDGAQGADEPAAQQAEAVSEVSAAVEAISADEGVVLSLETIAEENVIEPESTVLTADEIASAIADGTRHELVILSDNVKDAKVIIDNLAEGTEVLTLDRSSDVLDQINEYLDKSGVKYDAIHMVSHGGDGYLLINNSIIDMESLKADPASWAAIGEHMTENGDMLLYGCNIANTENGKAFANQLAALTGADVAASVDSVGGSYGWELEYTTATVSSPAFSFTDYNNQLASYTFVDSGSESYNWVANQDGEKYYKIADNDTILIDTDGNEHEVKKGQLYSITEKYTPAQGETPAKTEIKHTVEPYSGNLLYILTQAAESETADIITISQNNLSSTTTSLSLGDITNAVNAGGLTITNGAEVSLSFSADDYLTNHLSISGGTGLSAGSNITLWGGSISVSGVNGSSVTFKDITVVAGNFDIQSSVDNLNFDAVTVNSTGTFSASNAPVDTRYFNHTASNITFTGAVNITDSDFEVKADDGETGVVIKSSITFKETFSATGTDIFKSKITITASDPYQTIDKDSNVLNDNASAESRIVFTKAVTLDDDVNADFSAFYVGFDSTLSVSATNTGSNLTISDFAEVKLTGAVTLGGEGSNGSITFNGTDREYENNVGAFGDKYRVYVNGNLTVGKDSSITVNNALLDVYSSTVSHLGDINGENSEVIFRGGVTLKNTGFDGGTVHLDSVRYEHGIKAINDANIYWGSYGNLGLYLAGNNNGTAKDYTIGVDLLQLVTIENITFINQDNDLSSFKGSNANVTMSGQFYKYQATMDFEFGSEVNVIYNSPSQQYVMAGNYYELTVTNTAEKILAGSITVGVDAPTMESLKFVYNLDLEHMEDLRIYARKTEHLYRGGMTLGTTLNVGDNNVDFYGYTVAATDKALIHASGNSTVSYHVAHNLVRIPDLVWRDGMPLMGVPGLGLNDVAHENGGVGPNEEGNVRSDEDYKAFYGGTYANLQIDTMPTLAFSGQEILGQDTITFKVDVDATISKSFSVASTPTPTNYVEPERNDLERKHHHFTVDVSSTLTLNNTSIVVSDASVNFKGGVLGDISRILAVRDRLYDNSGFNDHSTKLNVTFDTALSKIGTITTNGIELIFKHDVQQVGSIDVYGWLSNVHNAKLTFDGAVNIQGHITTHTEYDVAKPILTFNGKTTGGANTVVDSYRGTFNFNYDGDQQIFAGDYDDFNITGSGVKTVVGDTAIRGIFNGNETTITIAENAGFALSTLVGDTAADPHRPEFTVRDGATLQFGNANTDGMDFYGTIISSGNVKVYGKNNFYGTITFENNGNMIVDDGADGSRFAEIINKGSGLTLKRDITIDLLHNYGTLTINNDDVKLDVYNHNGGNIVFNLYSGSAENGEYKFIFKEGENPGTGNKLVNGGFITVERGTLELENFTQGDKNAETGRWTYGGEGFAVGKTGTLIFKASAAQINSGNQLTGEMDSNSYLGSIANSGTVEIDASVGDIAFAGSIINVADSQFILKNTQATFNGNFTNDGSLTSQTAAGTNIIFGANSKVSGSGTIGGTEGYDGTVAYNGSNQQILTGIYNGAVTLSSGTKTVNGDVVFNALVTNSATINGNGSNITFNADTQNGVDKNGVFTGSLNVTYSADASTVFAGSYGNLDINSNTRAIGVDITADNLTLSGNNTFNGTAEDRADINVNTLLTLADGSQVTFGEFSSLNANSLTAAVIKGGKNGGSITFSTVAVGENVTVNPDGLLAAVTYNYAGDENQQILTGTYLNGVTLSGASDKVFAGSVSITGSLISGNGANMIVSNGSTLEVLGAIKADTLTVEQGAVLNLNLNSASTLGTDGSETGVTFGGTLNLRGTAVLTVYGWQDMASIGEINVNGGFITFAGTPEEYGMIHAIVNDNTDSTTAIVDNGLRLLNLSKTISVDSFTSQFSQNYGAYRIINGATLTVDSFQVARDSIESFKVEDGSTLVFAMDANYNGTSITVNNLLVEADSSMIVNSDRTVEIMNTADIAGSVTGEGNVTFNTAGNFTGTGIFNMTAGSVTYGDNVNVYGGNYNTLNLGTNTMAADVNVSGDTNISGSVTIDGADVVFNSVVMTGAAGLVVTNSSNVAFNGSVSSATAGMVVANNSNVAFNGTTSADGTAKMNAEVGTRVYYGQNADVYAGSYGTLAIEGAHTIEGDLNVLGDAVFSGEQSGSGNWTFEGSTTGAGTVDNTGSVIYNGSSTIFSGSYNDLTVNASNGVAGNLEVTGTLTIADRAILSGSGDWTIADTGADENSTGMIQNQGSVTYNGLAADEEGWIYSGLYTNLTVENGTYAVGNVDVNGEVSGSGTIVFTGYVAGEGTAANVNAAYYGSGRILNGEYNNLYVYGTAGISVNVTVNGALTAMGENAAISGNGTLTLAGTLVDFDTLGQFAYSGEVILSGTSEPFSLRGQIGTLTVEENVSVSLNNAHINDLLRGEGDVILGANATAYEVNMTDGTVYYTDESVSTILRGTYNNLTLMAYNKTFSVSNIVHVKGTFDFNGLNGNSLHNTGDLTIYALSNAYGTMVNSGTLRFGSNDAAVDAPAERQYWYGYIYNSGEVIINRGNYSIDHILHYDETNQGIVTVAADAVSSDIVTIGLYSQKGTVINLNADAYLHDYDNYDQFTNRGTLNISENAGTYNSGMHIVNVHNAEINVNNTHYLFGQGGIQLTNGGKVTVSGENGHLFFTEVNENIAGMPVYATADGGTLYFAFTDDSVNFANGLLGDIENHEGEVYFLADGQKYLGNVKNGKGTTTRGDMYILADSTFGGTFHSTYGIVSVGDYGSDVSVNFLSNVFTGSRFIIESNTHVAFESTLDVRHEFYMESGSEALFRGTVSIYSISSNTGDTLFHVKDGATAVFYDNVMNANGYGVSNTGAVNTTVSSSNYATKYISELRIDGNVTVNGKLTNVAFGYNGSWSEDNQARVVIESDGNVFGAIENLGYAARFDMNSDNNQFNGSVINTGKLYLNGSNDYNDLVNKFQTTTLASGASKTHYGYIWINDGAAGSSFRGIENAAGTTFTVGSYSSEGIELSFDGPVTNAGTFNLNAPGYVFNGAVKNSNILNVFAAGTFNGKLTNSSDFSVSVEGVIFGEVENTSLFTINAENTTFTGLFTNKGTLNINVDGITFPELTNSGEVNLHSANNTVVEILTQKGGTVDIDKNSTLHLNVVSDDDKSSIIVRGDRNGVYDDHEKVNVSDSSHGLFFENVVDPADPQKFIKQTINASIVYDTEFVESAVWFNDEYTYLVGEESEWIVISTDVTLDNISTKGKYRVVDGGILTVLNTAISSRFQVKGDGQLIFAGTNNRILTGLIEVKSEDGSLIFSGNNTFNNVITNLGTVTIAKDSKVTLNRELVNSGTVLAYASVNGMVENTGTYKVMADGLKLNTTNFDNTNGTLVVNANLNLNWDVKGTVSVTAEGHLAVNGVTEVTADIVNNGVIEFSNEYNYLALSGDIEKGNGTFKSATPATMVFSGNVATGTAAVFDNISNVVYDSLASEGQNIILGTYNNLQIEGSFKTVDDGTVTVAGNFVNNLNPGGGVMITDDGELILKGEVSGTGAFTNAGTLTFAESAEGTAASIVNGGTVNLNADDFTVADGENKGTYNINGKNAALTMTNGKAGKVVINGTNAALSGMNLGNVTVNGSAVTTMEDKAGASYDVTGKGTLSLGDNGNGGVYNATINNAGKVTVDTDITDFAGGVANNGTIQVNGGMSSNAVNDLFAGNGSGLLQLNNNGIDLQNTTVNGNVEVNYALEGDDLKGVTVAENALLEINKSSGILTSVIANNKGTVQIDKKAEVTFDMAEAGFNGVYNVDGSLTVNGNAEFDGSVNNSGTISVNGAAAFKADVDNSGSINAFETDFNAAINNSGSVAAVYADFNGAVNNTGSINAADSDFNGAVNNTGSITTEYVDFNAAVNNSGSIKADDADFNGPLNNSNTITVESEGNFAGSVNNSGNIASGAEGVLTFSGATQGNGTVKGNAVYNDKAVAVFGGNYSELTVNNAAQLSTSAQVDTMNLNGSLATAENAVLTLNGATKGKGSMAGGKGTVVYNGFSAEQTIYAGTYNNLSLGKSAIGVFNTAGDITISGDAFDLSEYAELSITGNKVTYNGTGTQHVMGGTYDELVMAGSGTKLMEADTFKVNSFVSNGGSSSNMLRLVSASAPEQWFLDANSISINYSYIDNAKTTGKIFLDGTNMTGGGNSDNWLVFNSAGGVGDSYPSINNPNFQAISLHLLALDEFWNGTGRFDAFRRMPVATQAIAVGDMSAPMVLDAAAGYDMIDFDGEFFGSADSIGILDEEASDVLNDAASADNGDLKALLEK